MASELNPTMGRVIARAWSDAAFKARLLAEPKPALAELGIDIPPAMTILARENTAAMIHLVLGAPPIVLPISPLSDIKAFAETYRDPRLWPLNWRGRDPVAAARTIADPKGELSRLGVFCPEGVSIVVLANTPSLTHLILPPRPAEADCTPALLARIEAGHAPAAMRLGRLLGHSGEARLLAQA